MESFKPLIAKVAAGATLTRTEAEGAFDSMLSGEVTPSQMGGFLMALRVRGETVDEITGAVAAMRAKMISVKAPPDAIDIVGTGGDGSGSYNVSTLAAIITAACGVPVAKHGNRAMSSRSGAADTLAALGVKIGLSPDGVERCIREAGNRLHDGARPSCVDAPCRSDAGGARHPHDLQSAWTALQSGRRQTPARWRLLGRLARADGRSAAEFRLRARLGDARPRRSRRDHRHRADQGRRAERRRASCL